LKDGLEASIDTQTLTLIPNLCNGVVITSGTNTLNVVGVTLYSAAASTYIYLGKKGQFPCFVGSTACTLGGLAACGCAAGSVQLASSAETQEIVGRCVATASASKFCMIDFNIV
jgi:hypothetical protein